MATKCWLQCAGGSSYSCDTPDNATPFASIKAAKDYVLTFARTQPVAHDVKWWAFFGTPPSAQRDYPDQLWSVTQRGALNMEVC